MLIVALVLAVIGLAALVTAVVTSNELIAWVCIAASVIGVILLIVDAVRERSRGETAETGAQPDEDDSEAALSDRLGYEDHGLEGIELEHMLEEVLAIPDRNQQSENSEARRRRIAASIACHAAIKINQPLDQEKIAWLLDALSKTEHPTACPHGRPIALRYSHKDIARAFQRI